jgi:hypothetical protein
MNEMIERVAKALCARVAEDGWTNWEDLPEDGRAIYLNDARAAIEAMGDIIHCVPMGGGISYADR